MKITVHWRYNDTSKELVRIWLPEWSGDQFDVVDTKEFNAFVAIASRLGTMFEKHEDDD